MKVSINKFIFNGIFDFYNKNKHYMVEFFLKDINAHADVYHPMSVQKTYSHNLYDIHIYD